MKGKKLEYIQQVLKDYWGFSLHKNDPTSHGRRYGDWKTGYTLSVHLHGSSCEHYRSLAEVERSYWMKEALKETKCSY